MVKLKKHIDFASYLTFDYVDPLKVFNELNWLKVYNSNYINVELQCEEQLEAV